MLEPQSTVFFVLLIVAFAALLWWMSVAKHLVLRILAGCLAFIPAVMFGVAAVNKYYDYYPNWSSAIADLTNQNLPAPVLPYVARRRGSRLGGLAGGAGYGTSAARDGFTLRLIVRGPVSHITRSVYVYLPPQYFQAAYSGYRFPAIELIHGFPGVPQDWITVLGVNATFRNLIGAGLAKPAVLVMPDASGGRGVSLQCLNQAGGPQDATYLAEDLPGYISRVLRVVAPGRAWGIAGYSEGGFCAANLALRYPDRFGFSGVLSGYFEPLANQLGHAEVSPFGGNLRLELANTPDYELASLPAGATIPQFWLGAGTRDRSGVRDTEAFYQLLRPRQPWATLKLVPGGHTAYAWRQLLAPMLEWMTRGLAQQAPPSYYPGGHEPRPAANTTSKQPSDEFTRGVLPAPVADGGLKLHHAPDAQHVNRRRADDPRRLHRLYEVPSRSPGVRHTDLSRRGEAQRQTPDPSHPPAQRVVPRRAALRGAAPRALRGRSDEHVDTENSSVGSCKFRKRLDTADPRVDPEPVGQREVHDDVAVRSFRAPARSLPLPGAEPGEGPRKPESLPDRGDGHGHRVTLIGDERVFSIAGPDLHTRIVRYQRRVGEWRYRPD